MTEPLIIDAHAHIFNSARPQIAPAQFSDGRFPAARLLELMDAEGVAKAVLLQNPLIGTINGEVQAAIEEYPERFAGVIQVDPLDSQAVGVIQRFCRLPHQRSLKLEMSEEWGWSGVHPGIQLDGGALRPLWEAVSENGLNVIIDPGPVGNNGYQVEHVDALSDAFPETRFLLEHLGYLCKQDVGNAKTEARRLEMVRLAKKPNIFLGFSATAALLEEEHPCPQAVELLREAVGLVGAEKILWGSDAPLTLQRYTYRQMIDVVAEGCDFLSGGQRRQILGENAGRMFFE